MEKLALTEHLKPRFVTGENISQTFQFVKSGNAELGFIALSQVMQNGQITQGSSWLVPEDLHAPINQDAVLLQRGEDNVAAQDLLAFLQSEAATAILKAYGYQIPQADTPDAE